MPKEPVCAAVPAEVMATPLKVLFASTSVKVGPKRSLTVLEAVVVAT